MKTLKIILTLFFVSLSSASYSAEITVKSFKIGTTKFTNATITYTDGSSAKISHDNGIKKVKLDQLPKDILDQLGLTEEDLSLAKEAAISEAEQQKIDEEKEKKLNAKRAEAKAKRDAELERSEEFEVVVYGYFENGILCYGATSKTIYTSPIASSSSSVGGGGGSIKASSYKKLLKHTYLKFFITGMKNPRKFAKDEYIKFKGLKLDPQKIDGTTFTAIKMLEIVPEKEDIKADTPVLKKPKSREQFRPSSRPTSPSAQPKRAVGI